MSGSYKRKQRIITHQRYVERKRLNRLYSYKDKSVYVSKSYIRKPYNSEVLQILELKNFCIHSLNSEDKVDLIIPNVFCFSKNPDETILFLRKLYTNLLNKNVNHIHFNHLNCQYIGICASTIMDIIVLECLKWRDSMDYDIELSGEMVDGKASYNSEVDGLVKISGLLNHLGICHDNSMDTEQLGLIKNESSSKIAENCINYINSSLKHHGYVLTKAGNNLFGNFVGEIIDNCKDHGGENVVWFTAGHYSYDSENKTGKCKLCIVDFGDTIYEGLKFHSSNKALKRINHFVKKSWYSRKAVKNEEILYTLFSLQQRASRIIEKDTVRGNGTVTYIESFLNLFNNKGEIYESLLSITSGKCSILFDGTYTTSSKNYNNGFTNKFITFNQTNALYDPPDAKFVRSIENGFPGTVISMDLYIDNKYLRRSR